MEGENIANVEARLAALEREIATIKERNRRVESDKRWETSGARFLCVAALTYLTMNLILWTIGGPFPPLHAIVPTAGFLLSTVTLPRVKARWTRADAKND